MNSGTVRFGAGVWPAIVLVTAALYFAREICIPIALAVLPKPNNSFPDQSRSAPNQTGKALVEKPITVEMHDHITTPFKIVQSVFGNLFRPLATAGIVVVFVIFMLVQREDLRNRLLRLLGSGKLKIATQALDEAGQRVSRYLLMQLMVNSSYGLLIGLGLYFIGIPNALVWGLAATFLRFIPYAGAVLAAIMPIGLAFAVDPGWIKPTLTAVLFVVSELIVGNIIEPWLYGSSTGISSFAVLIAAVFWAWLWGPVGLLLATPLTVCLAVLGRCGPQVEFLHIILSDEPVLPDEARFYQRLLANDTEEAAEVAEEVLKKQSMEFLFDRVILPALSLTEHDRNEGILDAQRFKFILDSTKEIIEELAVPEQDGPKAVADGDGPGPIAVLCIPAKDEADELFGIMLAHLLRRKNVPAMSVSASSLANERFQEVKRSSAPVICVSALPPSALRQARLFCKRLRAEFPELTIIVGVWTRSPDLERIHSRLPSDLVSQVVTSLSEAVEIIRPMVANQATMDARAPDETTLDSKERLVPADRGRVSPQSEPSSAPAI
jgi:AI-2E family transporter